MDSEFLEYYAKSNSLLTFENNIKKYVIVAELFPTVRDIDTIKTQSLYELDNS